MAFIKRLIVIILLFIPLSLLLPKAYAATLSNASDTLTTSRPSASAPLAANQLTTDTQVTVVDLPTTTYNSALWLASDSAVLNTDTGQTLNTVTVASMSAANTPASNQRIVYLTAKPANTHHAGTAMFTNITATHTIDFGINTSLPANGRIIITFPGSGSSIASPSATGFSFNGESATPTDIKCVDVTANNGVDCTSGTGGSYAMSGNNTITITTGATFGSVISGHTLSIAIGCSAISNAGICTTFAPRLINPVKTNAAAGTADTWKISLQTTDTVANGGGTLDTSKVIAGIIESVQVQGTIEPNLTFTISGQGTSYQGCTQAGGDDTTNTGIATSATFVNLGNLTSAQVNHSYQTISIDTNGSFGYNLTATSSGVFINPASGFALADANGGTGLTAVPNTTTNPTTPVPAAIAANTEKFGIHACANASSTTTPTIPSGWGTGGGATNKYSNPWNSGTNGYYALLAYTTAPSAASKTDVEYAAAVKSTTPAGVYTTVLTYVATPSF